MSLDALPGRRTVDLLAYLLLYRERPHHREVLAGTLWPETGTAQSRKYLRQSLWHLRSLGGKVGCCAPLVNAEADWVCAACDGIWVDVAELEHAFDLVKFVHGENVEPQQARCLREAVELYRGDLLEGCYQDWCTYERERLKAMYISLLEKLLGYCETHSDPEEGIVYGNKLLQQDRAHERAHLRLMRLHCLAGDRTAALRQYERCRDALQEELGTSPGKPLQELYERIRAGTPIETPVWYEESPVLLGAGLVVHDRQLPWADVPDAHAIAQGLQWQPDEPPEAKLQKALHALSFAGMLVEESIRTLQAASPKTQPDPP